MKRQWIFSLIIFLLIPRLSIAQTDSPNVPNNVQLTATETTVTVDWNGDSDADGYYVHWGTASGSLNNKETVNGTNNTEYTISNLTPGTTYYVAVSAFDDSGDESSRSNTQNITTTRDIAKPATPTGFDVTSVQSIAEDSVILKWDKNSESDLDHYTIYYGTTSGSTAQNQEAQNDDASSFTVSELSASTRYYFSISATDVADNESDKSQSLIVDTLVDTLPPYAPAKVSGSLSNINEITITIADGNAQMADFAGNKLFYSTTSGNLDNEVDLGNAFTYAIPNLEENTTLYFAALSYDSHGNESDQTDEASATVEETKRYLDESGDFDGGCFIGSSGSGTGGALTGGFYLIFLVPIIAWLFYRRRDITIIMMAFLLAVSFAGYSSAATSEDFGPNIAGIFAGYYLPVESQFEDFYDDDVLLISAFYERQLNDLISMDLESGFMKQDGHLLTESGAETGIGTDLTIIPVSVSLNVYRKLLNYVVGYVGAGPDYWYCMEETDAADVFPKIEEWVGGCHAKAGLKLYNTDPRFGNTGAIVETSYSWIDRFGGNDTDLGGWAFKFGLFYQF